MKNVVAFSLCFLTAPASGARLKELVEVEGIRKNPLVGVGLVVGLAGTGDDASSVVMRKPLATVLRHLGTQVDPAEIKAKNVALVMVTAELPPFARPGMRIDVTVSSSGTAKSLQGGTLIATYLKGADRQVYAIAQGAITLGGFVADGASGSSARKNHVTAGRVPGGAVVEREAPSGLPNGCVVLVLREPDVTTATRIADAINRSLAAELARVRDPAVVVVQVDGSFRNKPLDLLAALEAVEAEPDVVGRVVIDERTGTIAVGANVTLGPCAIAHGGITVQVAERPGVSQPAPFGRGQTTTVPETQVDVEEAGGRLAPLAKATTVADVAAALNALGLKPRDLVAVFQALKVAGALRAELQVM